jgi:proteasome accessory factor C
VLALVPWILANPGVTMEELATRFEVSERELERDLELLPMCGLPPYTADRLIDVSVIDGGVEIRLAEYFERPLRLTPAEGLGLLAAGRALLAVPGSDADGPLATALAKLDDALGAPGSLAVDVGASDQLQRLQEAAAGDERVEIDYYSFARDEMTTRVIDPWRVFHAFGTWYVAGWCHRADGERLFRVDRVRGVRATGERFDPATRGDDERDLVYHPSPDDPRVTLRLAPEAEWVVESHPHESATRRKDGSWDVVLAVSEPAWLERLLVGLGPAATVVAPPQLADLPATAAARLRARYAPT